MAVSNAESKSDDESTSNVESAANAEPSPSVESASNAESEPSSDSASTSDSDSDSTSMADRLETVGTVVWLSFLGFVVVLGLIPAVAVLFGTAPFDPPSAAPYLAFVGLTLLGTAALVAAAVFNV